MQACKKMSSCTGSQCRTEALLALRYAEHIRTPRQLADDPSRGVFIMNVAGPGHMELGQKFSTALGLQPPERGLAAARRLHASDTPISYMTLTNDHLPSTERAHDATLRWERATQGMPSRHHMRFIGPPGVYTDEATRKKDFCRWSEQLARAHGDRSLRYSLPCAVGEATPGEYRSDYEQLLREEEAAPLSRGSANANHPLWLVRTLRGKNRVIAFGVGMRLEVLPTVKIVPESLQPGKSLLLRFLDPPLLQRGVHLGSPVSTRFEVRLHGLIQWQPLRVWISGHGFARAGSPWWNYSSTRLDESNRLMWELSAAPDPSCAALPRDRAPWVSPERYQTCAAKDGARKDKRQPAGCCICQTVADALDVEHNERGFATTGTHLKVEQIARQNGIAPGVLWRNADEAIVRYLMKQEDAFITGANGSTLSRWHSPFSVDVAFSADGKAWVYDSHLLPTWKRQGHWRNRLVDRANALGFYASMMLAMSHTLMSTEAVDQLHRTLLPTDLPTDGLVSKTRVLEFLRDQGIASVLGFRRAWPSPRHARLERVASSENRVFARTVHELGLLLPSLDSVLTGSHARRRKDLLLDESTPIWPFSGLLYSNHSKPAMCEDFERVRQGWSNPTLRTHSGP